MDKKEKRKLSESDICDLFISPAIRDAGWDPLQQIRREVTLTPGRYRQRQYVLIQFYRKDQTSS